MLIIKCMNLHKTTKSKLQIFCFCINTFNCELGVVPFTQFITNVLSDIILGIFESFFHGDCAVRKLQVMEFSFYCK